MMIINEFLAVKTKPHDDLFVMMAGWESTGLCARGQDSFWL